MGEPEELEQLQVKLAAALVVAETQAEELERLKASLDTWKTAAAESTTRALVIKEQYDRLTTQAEELERAKALIEAFAATGDLNYYVQCSDNARDFLTTTRGDQEDVEDDELMRGLVDRTWAQGDQEP